MRISKQSVFVTYVKHSSRWDELISRLNKFSYVFQNAVEAMRIKKVLENESSIVQYTCSSHFTKVGPHPLHELSYVTFVF